MHQQSKAAFLQIPFVSSVPKIALPSGPRLPRLHIFFLKPLRLNSLLFYVPKFTKQMKLEFTIQIYIAKHCKLSLLLVLIITHVQGINEASI